MLLILGGDPSMAKWETNMLYFQISIRWQGTQENVRWGFKHCVQAVVREGWALSGRRLLAPMGNLAADDARGPWLGRNVGDDLPFVHLPSRADIAGDWSMSLLSIYPDDSRFWRWRPRESYSNRILAGRSKTCQRAPVHSSACRAWVSARLGLDL